ncbi:MAG TPA: hypothetical protein VIG42_08255 [Solirubrobacteraceae bacterium]
MAVGAKRHRTRRIAVALGGSIALLLVLAQVFLPSIAAKVLADRMARYGRVQNVHVSAFPAVKLLWGKADSVTATANTLSLPAAKIASLVWEARATNDMTVTARAVNVRAAMLPAALVMSDVRVEKRGSTIHATATLTQAQLDGALPSGFHVQPIASGGGQVEVHASGALFGLQASIDALVLPLEGRLITEPKGLPFGGITAVTLFSDRHLKVQSVGVRVLSQTPLAYGLSMEATLR